jgi:hypothetical protein
MQVRRSFLARLAPIPAGIFLVASFVSVSACDPEHIREVIQGGNGSGSGGGMTPPGLTCGGIAGLKCPGGGTCVDNPNDSCDPNKGGADCGGTCQCVEKVLCVKGLVFDPSPTVCACAAPAPPPPVCGPVCDIYCEYGHVLDAKGCETCSCNPAPAAPKVSCGGIAGLACPGGGKCVDDPSDGCDPQKGGADCGGICQCIQTVDCIQGAKFDSSPKVCACVPPSPVPPPVCGPVCQIFCEHGNVLDASGCPICKCNPPPTTDPCAAVRCAAGTHCEAQPVMCIKEPCPPVAACVPDAPPPVSDCAKVTCMPGSHCALIAPPCAPGAGACPTQATCVPDAPRVQCTLGGNGACPGGGKCVDDPTDKCDPQQGIACAGICQCIQTVACIKGTTFDSSPKVCACM